MKMSAEAAVNVLKRAKTALLAHKETIKTVIGGAEGFGAATLVGIAEGRLTEEGHVTIAGVPLTLGLGVIGVAAGASGVLDDYGTHAANMGTGLLGAYGHRLGQEVGSGMRLSAGKNIKTGLLPAVKVQEIQDKAKKANKPYGAIVGWQDRFTGECAVGAAPAPLTSAQLEQMVREASAATP